MVGRPDCLETNMAYVVAEPCVKCKYTDCVAVCPVDCFYEGENMLVIHPDECIDCGACEPECPSTAIFEEADLPPKWAAYTEVNALFSGSRDPRDFDLNAWPQPLRDKVKAHVASGGNTYWPIITEQQMPLPGADDEKDVQGKTADFSPKPGH